MRKRRRTVDPFRTSKRSSFHYVIEKELAMSGTSPNRIRNQISELDLIMQKKSGDQHIEPQDEPAEAPYRPHRVNREDMQKVMPPSKDTDDSKGS
jgi:hypothetical protein